MPKFVIKVNGHILLEQNTKGCSPMVKKMDKVIINEIKNDVIYSRSKYSGTYITSDGGRILGHWTNDILSGTGRYNYPNGDSYEGEQC